MTVVNNDMVIMGQTYILDMIFDTLEHVVIWYTSLNILTWCYYDIYVAEEANKHASLYADIVYLHIITCNNIRPLMESRE